MNGRVGREEGKTRQSSGVDRVYGKTKVDAGLGHRFGELCLRWQARIHLDVERDGERFVVLCNSRWPGVSPTQKESPRR